jgi:hypothetical protein
VKRLQLWLLAFLMAILPFRGALAEVLPCPFAVHVSPSVQAQTGTDQQLVRAEHCLQAGAASVHGRNLPASSGAGACHELCAGACALTPLLSASASLPLASTSSTVTYPALQAIAADFFSDGQERPPRRL